MRVWRAGCRPPQTQDVPVRSGSLSRAAFLAGGKAIQQSITEALGRKAIGFAVPGAAVLERHSGGLCYTLMGETWVYGDGPDFFSEAVALLPASEARRYVNTGNAAGCDSEPGRRCFVIADVFPESVSVSEPAFLPRRPPVSELTRMFRKPSVWSAGLGSAPAPGVAGEDGGRGQRAALGRSR